MMMKNIASLNNLALVKTTHNGAQFQSQHKLASIHGRFGLIYDDVSYRVYYCKIWFFNFFIRVGFFQMVPTILSFQENWQ